MSFYENPRTKDLKTQDKIEVGQKEDLGANVSADLARDYKNTEEKLDVKPEFQTKSPAEIQADIKYFREQIKSGETKDANGKYNEKMILENEAKLREAEQALVNIQEESNKEEEIMKLRQEIEGYRQNIELGETKDANGKYNEKLVLENEAKLKEAENRINALNNVMPTYTPTEEGKIEEKAEKISTKPKKKSFWKKIFG